MTVAGQALTESFVTDHVRPLFSRVLENPGGGVYLANHSLGRPPDAMATNLIRFADEWARYLDDCWTDEFWVGEVELFRSQIANLIGLTRADAVVPKTSAGQGLRAVLNALPQDRKLNVVATTGEFDSIDFILKTYAYKGRANVKWCGPTASEGPVPLFEPNAIVNAIDDKTDLVVVSAVFFTTGQVMKGLDDIVRAAHKNNALVLVDAYHAVGVVPFDMTAIDADFVIGGCYKYLRGGPGACYLAIHPRHLDDPKLRTLDTGWFAKKDAFHYQRSATPEFAVGGDAWLESTPPVATAYQANPGIAFVVDTGVGQMRRYNLELLAELRDKLAVRGIEVFDPARPEDFGSFVLVSRPDAPAYADKLKDSGVVVDARSGFVRLGPDVLNTRDELEEAAVRVQRAW